MAELEQQSTAEVNGEGVQDAGERLLRAFGSLRDELLSSLLFVLGSREDAQDAAQDAFLKCWASRAHLDQVLNIRAWIFRVSFNTAKDMQRSAWNRRIRPLRGEDFMPAINQQGPGHRLEVAESVDCVRKAILNLRDDEKEVFLLRQNGELTYEQIAEMRHVPVGTIKTQMRSALEKLRKQLD